VKKRLKTIGRVEAADGVAGERLTTGCGVLGAGGVAGERKTPVAVLRSPVVLLKSAV
jgi:hypothetical protein